MKIRVTCNGCSRIMLATVQETVEIIEVKCPNCSKILQCKIKVKSQTTSNEEKLANMFGQGGEFEKIFGDFSKYFKGVKK